MALDPSLVQELKESYDKIASEKTITRDTVGEVFKEAGEAQPAFQIRDVCDKMGKKEGATVSFDDFIKMCQALDLTKLKSNKYKDHVQAKTGVTVLSGYEQTASGTLHSVTDAERVSFTNYINRVLADDPDVKKRLPLNPEGDDLYVALQDGLILCKLVNIAVPGTVDERAINKAKITTFTSIENLNLGLNSCVAIGCHVVNVHSQDIMDKRVHLILGVLWQIIKLAMFKGIDLKVTPDLACMLRPGETLKDLLSLTPEELLLRWVNYQIEKVGYPGHVTNFGTDLKDSSVYAALEEAIMKNKMVHSRPAITSHADHLKRAGMVVENAVNAGVISMASAYDIVNCNHKLNMVFLADMFNRYPNLQAVEDQPVIEETREEKCYRNWMNSLGVSPFVSYLYSDLSTGNILLQLFDILTPKCVNWQKVNKPPFKENRAMLEKLENCNMVIDLAKKHGLSVVGVSGDNIINGPTNLVLGLVWQMMARYNLQILQTLSGSDKPINDQSIIAWINGKLSNSKSKITVQSFKDPSVMNAHAIFDLVEALRPNTVAKNLVLAGKTDEEKLTNANLAISLCRKIGAKVYALPEDVVEGKAKMVMTIFACLMIVDLSPK
ncbi:Plastin-2 [Thelohanellus kitauei]|uniref:Plastin-2 n=1 Tax=Thelohanellus kitauei TaxID=669202 RepID=A0A0C2MKZ4_THEKT|nr:Plastin-2 [Thelohanellus kitauei]